LAASLADSAEENAKPAHRFIAFVLTLAYCGAAFAQAPSVVDAE
jgi:hypothetical protein